MFSYQPIANKESTFLLAPTVMFSYQPIAGKEITFLLAPTVMFFLPTYRRQRKNLQKVYQHYEYCIRMVLVAKKPTLLESVFDQFSLQYKREGSKQVDLLSESNKLLPPYANPLPPKPRSPTGGSEPGGCGGEERDSEETKETERRGTRAK